MRQHHLGLVCWLLLAWACVTVRAGCNADIGGTDIQDIDVAVAGGSKGTAAIAPGKTFNLTFKGVLSWSTEITSLDDSMFAVAVYQNDLLLAKDYNLECVGWPRMQAGSCPSGGTVVVMLLCDPSSNVTCNVEYWMSNDLAKVNCALVESPSGAPTGAPASAPTAAAGPSPIRLSPSPASSAPVTSPAPLPASPAPPTSPAASHKSPSPSPNSKPRLLLDTAGTSSVCKDKALFNKCMTALVVDTTGSPGAAFNLTPQVSGCDAGSGTVGPSGTSASGIFASGWGFEVDAGQYSTTIRFNYTADGGAWGWCSAVYDVDGGCVLGQCSRGATLSPAPGASSSSGSSGGSSSPSPSLSPSPQPVTSSGSSGGGSSSSSNATLSADLTATSSVCKEQTFFATCLQQLTVDLSGGGFTLRPDADGCEAGGGSAGNDGTASGDFPGGWSWNATPGKYGVEITFDYMSSGGGPGYCSAIYDVVSGCVLGKCA